MGSLLNVIVGWTPCKLIAAVWALLLAAALLNQVTVLSGLATALGLIAVCGYPYIVLLGLRPHPSGALVRVTAQALFVGFVIVIALTVLWLPRAEGLFQRAQLAPDLTLSWRMSALALFLNVTLWLPFLLATHVVDERRRRLGTYGHFQSIPTFLGLLYGLFGGYLYVHKRVRETYGVPAGQAQTRGQHAG